MPPGAVITGERRTEQHLSVITVAGGLLPADLPVPTALLGGRYQVISGPLGHCHSANGHLIVVPLLEFVAWQADS